MTQTGRNGTRIFLAAVAAFTLVIATGRCQAKDAPKETPKPAAKEAPKEAPKEAAKEPTKKDAKAAGQTIEMKVTDKGFEPANLTVSKDQPVTLVITRVTEKTCATEIVIDDYGVNTKLPLNTAVTVNFTPKKAGTLKYGCAMGKMISGVLKIQ